MAGYRSGWLVITGPKDHAASFIEGISLLANMRLCPNVPAQYAIQVALGEHQSIEDLVLPGGRLLEQRDVAVAKLNEIPGVSCVKPQGALYVFPPLYTVALAQQLMSLVLDLGLIRGRLRLLLLRFFLRLRHGRLTFWARLRVSRRLSPRPHRRCSSD